MNHISDHIRQHLSDSVGMPRTLEYKHIPDLDELRRIKWDAEFMRVVCGVTEISFLKRGLFEHQFQPKLDEFLQYMRNRLVLGTFRYRVWEGDRSSHDYPRRIEERTKRYVEDGNLEHLVDAANFALVENVLMKPPKKTNWGPHLMRAPPGPDAILELVDSYRQQPALAKLMLIAALAMQEYVRCGHPKKHFGDADHAGEFDRPDGSKT